MKITKYSVSVLGTIRYNVKCDCGHQFNQYLQDGQIAKCPICNKSQPISNMYDNIFHKTHYEAMA